MLCLLTFFIMLDSIDGSFINSMCKDCCESINIVYSVFMYICSRENCKNVPKKLSSHDIRGHNSPNEVNSNDFSFHHGFDAVEML